MSSNPCPCNNASVEVLARQAGAVAVGFAEATAVDDATADFEKLTQELDALGAKLGVDINIRNQEMYDAMHQL